MQLSKTLHCLHLAKRAGNRQLSGGKAQMSLQSHQARLRKRQFFFGKISLLPGIQSRNTSGPISSPVICKKLEHVAHVVHARGTMFVYVHTGKSGNLKGHLTRTHTGKATKGKVQDIGEVNKVMPLPLPSSDRVRG